MKFRKPNLWLCDECGAIEEEDRHPEGWFALRRNNGQGWIDLCPKCQNLFPYAQEIEELIHRFRRRMGLSG